jgi:hypothetical protein
MRYETAAVPPPPAPPSPPPTPASTALSHLAGQLSPTLPLPEKVDSVGLLTRKGSTTCQVAWESCEDVGERGWGKCPRVGAPEQGGSVGLLTKGKAKYETVRTWTGCAPQAWCVCVCVSFTVHGSPRGLAPGRKGPPHQMA